MGRAINSFTDWVGHPLEMEGDRVTLPEKDLWVRYYVELSWMPARDLLIWI